VGLDDSTGTFTRVLLTGLGGDVPHPAPPAPPRPRPEPVTPTERVLAATGRGWDATVAGARRLGARLAALRGDERTAMLAVAAVLGVVLLAIAVLVVVVRLADDGAPAPARAAQAAPSATSTAKRPSPSPARPTGGSFAARHSGYCLAVPAGREADNGAQLVQRTCGTDEAAVFRLVAKPGRGDAYSMVNAATGRCVDVAGGADANGTPVTQWDCHGGDNQTFRLRQVRGVAGYVQVIADHSDKCLDVGGASRDEGAPVHQWECHDAASEAQLGNQSWRISGD
jgi:glucosylceramidase